MNGDKKRRRTGGIPVEDFQFLMKTELLEATPEEFKRQLIASMTKTRINAGKSFITQAEKGDCFYLIQEGSCVVSLDKNGQSYPVSLLKQGEIVGELAVLTDDTRSANVHAEEDMVLWALSLATGRRPFPNDVCSC